MPNIILLQVEPGIQQRVEQQAEGAGQWEVERPNLAEAVLARVEADEPQVDVVVIGPAVADPLALAQRLHAIDRSLSLVLLAREDDIASLRQALLFTPFLGEDVTGVPHGDAAGAATQILQAAERRQRRKAFLQTSAAMNQQISQATTPPQIGGHFGRLLDHAPIGVVTIDQQGAVYGWNRHAQKLLDLSERRTLRQPLWSLFASPQREQLREYLCEAGQSELGLSTRTLDRSAVHGHPQFLDVSAMPVDVVRGQPGCIVLLQDVTAREQAQRQRDQAEEALHQQRQWYQATVMSIGDAIIATDAQGKITLMNRVAEQLTGWSLKEATGHDSSTVFHIVNETTRRPVTNPVNQVLESGVGIGLANHTVLLRKDGSEVPIDDSAAPIRDSAGNLVGAVLVFRDISARRQAERALRASEQRLRLILENLTDYVIFTMDLEGRITGWNSGARQVLGYEELEVRGRPASITFVPEDREAAVPEKELSEALEHGRSSDDRWHMRKDGSRFWANGLMTSLRDDEGRAHGLVKILRDQTDLHRYQEQLKARARQQAAVASFGHRALAGPPLQHMLDEAVEVVAETLHVKFVKVLRLLPDRESLLLEAGVGWEPELIGHAEVEATPASHAGYTLATGAPVVVANLSRETRFRGMPLLHEHGVVSGMSVIIGGPGDQPWGLLTAHTAERRKFSQDDIHFLQVMANILFTGIQRQRAEHKLEQLNQTLEQRVAQRTQEAEQRAAQLQRMVGEVTQAEQRERRRLAELLHDHLQQLLVAGKLQTDILSQQLQEPGLKTTTEKLARLLEESIDASRDLTAELSPPVLYTGGLIAALKWLSSWVKDKHQLQVAVEAEQPLELEDENRRVLVFQAVRELLFNTVKYAGVERAGIYLRQPNERQLQVQVVDQGRGFDPEQAYQPQVQGGFGLSSIRERIELIGGRIHIESAKGKGTTVALFVPLN